MSLRRENGFGLPVLLCMLMVLCFPVGLLAEQASNCKEPPELEGRLAEHPSAEAYDALGAYFGSKGQFFCAILAFESALLLNPNAWQGHYNLAIALISSGNAERAYQEMQAASQLNPGAPQIHLGLGVALSTLQQPDAAINEFQTVLKTEPKSIPALDGISKELIWERRYSAAIDVLQDAPPDEVLQLDLAIAYRKNGEPDNATHILSVMINENPANAQAHLNLGVVYAQRAQYHEAAREFQEALHLDPTNDVVRVSYVKALINELQYPTALPVIQDYLYRKAHDFDALELTGEVDCGLGNYAEAETLLQQAVAINPDHYNARYFLGFALVRLDKPLAARAQLEKALQLNPGSSEARFQLAVTLRSLGLQDQAREEFKIIQQKKEEAFELGTVTTTLNKANQSLEKADAQNAVEMYRQSIAQDPTNSHAYYDLAVALHGQGKYREERQALAKAMQLDPKFAPAHNQIGILDLQAGHTAEAERAFRAAILLDPQYAEAQNNLGVLCGRFGKTNQAEHLFREATENDSQYGQAFVNLGLILATESRFPEAEQVLQHALQLIPNDQTALTAQSMVLASLNRGTEAVK